MNNSHTTHTHTTTTMMKRTSKPLLNNINSTTPPDLDLNIIQSNISDRWPLGIENHIKSIGSKCAAYKWLHESSWKSSKRIHITLGFCHITLVSLTGALNVFTILFPSIRPELITTVVLFASIFISSSQQFLKYEEAAENAIEVIAEIANMESKNTFNG